MRSITLGLFCTLLLAGCFLGGSDADTCDPGGAPDAVATPTSRVWVNYEGRLQDGTQFDAGECSVFSLQGVIPGFREGIVGMRVGEEKTITVPPEKGYGSDGRPGIPPNATLIFDVELLGAE